MIKMKTLIGVATLAVSSVATTVWAETVNLYTYHLSPPFVSGKGEGLTYDLAGYLTEKSGGKYQFEVKELPRKRLNAVIESDDAGVVPWVMPAWFGDKDQTKHLWTEGFFPDGNALLSPASAPIEFDGDVESLHGLTMGGARGHTYQDIDAAVEAGKIKRQDAEGIEPNLKKLAAGRVDFVSAADSASRYLVAQMGFGDKIHFSGTPHTEYNRRFLVMQALPEVQSFLSGVVAAMPQDAKWQEIVSSYQ